MGWRPRRNSPPSGMCRFHCRAGRKYYLNTDETIPFLPKLDPRLLGATGHILMAVPNDLCSKRRVPAHLDRDVPPLFIPDVERIVIHERHGVLTMNIPDLAGLGLLHCPHRRPGF